MSYREWSFFIGIDKDSLFEWNWKPGKFFKKETGESKAIGVTILFIQIGYVSIYERDEVKLKDVKSI